MIKLLYGLVVIALTGCEYHGVQPGVPVTPVDPPFTGGPSRIVFAAQFAGAPMGVGWTFSDDTNNTTTNTRIERAVDSRITVTVTLPAGYSVVEWDGSYVSAGATRVTVDPAPGTRTVMAIVARNGNG